MVTDKDYLFLNNLFKRARQGEEIAYSKIPDRLFDIFWCLFENDSSLCENEMFDGFTCSNHFLKNIN